MKVFALLAISLAEVSMQEYYLSSNGSNFTPYQPTIELNVPVYQYDDIMRHYRSDIRKREPQFIGFDINDDNIEIDMEIAVPFLSVPTKKSLTKRKNFANVNVAAVILAGKCIYYWLLLQSERKKWATNGNFMGFQRFGGKQNWINFFIVNISGNQLEFKWPQWEKCSDIFSGKFLMCTKCWQKVVSSLKSIHSRKSKNELCRPNDY